MEGDATDGGDSLHVWALSHRAKVTRRAFASIICRAYISSHLLRPYRKNSCAKNIAFIFFHFVILPHIRSHKFGDACVPYGHHTASRTQRVEMDLWLSVHSMRWTDNSTSYALEILCDLFGSRGGWDFADGDMLSVMVDKGHLRATEQRHWPIWLMWHGESKRTLHWIPTGTGQMIYFFFFTVDCNASLFQRMFRKCRLSQWGNWLDQTNAGWHSATYFISINQKSGSSLHSNFGYSFFSLVYEILNISASLNKLGSCAQFSNVNCVRYTQSWEEKNQPQNIG